MILRYGCRILALLARVRFFCSMNYIDSWTRSISGSEVKTPPRLFPRSSYFLAFPSGKFVVSTAGEAYDSKERSSNRKFQLFCGDYGLFQRYRGAGWPRARPLVCQGFRQVGSDSRSDCGRARPGFWLLFLEIIQTPAAACGRAQPADRAAPPRGPARGAAIANQRSAGLAGAGMRPLSSPAARPDEPGASQVRRAGAIGPPAGG